MEFPSPLLIFWLSQILGFGARLRCKVPLRSQVLRSVVPELCGFAESLWRTEVRLFFNEFFADRVFFLSFGRFGLCFVVERERQRQRMVCGTKLFGGTFWVSLHKMVWFLAEVLRSFIEWRRFFSLFFSHIGRGFWRKERKGSWKVWKKDRVREKKKRVIVVVDWERVESFGVSEIRSCFWCEIIPDFVLFFGLEKMPGGGREVAESCVDSLNLELVATYCKRLHPNKPELAARRIEAIGYQVGLQLAER